MRHADRGRLAHQRVGDRRTLNLGRADPLAGHFHRIVRAAPDVPVAVGADLGVVFDRAAERLTLIDDRAGEIEVGQALLAFLRLLVKAGRSGKLAFPITVTQQVDRMVEGSGLEVVRTSASLAELTRVAAGDGVVFGGALGGGYVFPDFLPAYDAIASLCKLLELLAAAGDSLSEVVDGLPQLTLVHTQVPCPWALKGLVMRVLTERMKERETDVLDGIKVFDDRGWVQALPDPDEPVLHLYAEGETREDSEELETELRELVEGIMQGEEATART